MVIKTKFSRKEIEHILKDYNIGKLVRFGYLTKGLVQTNVLVVTTFGKYVLRYYENRSREEILFELLVLNYLHRRGYPCAQPIKNKKSSFIDKHNSKYYALFDFIEGKEVSADKINSAQLRSAVRHWRSYIS